MAVGTGGSAEKCANGSAAHNDSAAAPPFLPNPEAFLSTPSPQQQSRAQAQGQSPAHRSPATSVVPHQLVFSPPLPLVNRTKETSDGASPGTQKTLNAKELQDARRLHRNRIRRESRKRLDAKEKRVKRQRIHVQDSSRAAAARSSSLLLSPSVRVSTIAESAT